MTNGELISLNIKDYLSDQDSLKFTSAWLNFRHASS